MTAGDDVPRPPAAFHCVIDGGAPFTDDLTLVVLDRQQRLIERIGDGGGNCSKAGLTETAAILQDVTANQMEAALSAS